MSDASTGNDHDSETVTVSVSANGQATIPKAFREKLGIDTPGQVTFRETEDGEIVLERIPSAAEMEGFAAETGDANTEKSASELLQTKRDKERDEE